MSIVSDCCTGNEGDPADESCGCKDRGCCISCKIQREGEYFRLDTLVDFLKLDLAIS